MTTRHRRSVRVFPTEAALFGTAFVFTMATLGGLGVSLIPALALAAMLASQPGRRLARWLLAAAVLLAVGAVALYAFNRVRDGRALHGPAGRITDPDSPLRRWLDDRPPARRTSGAGGWTAIRPLPPARTASEPCRTLTLAEADATIPITITRTSG